jgi:hypothetical protein
MSKISKILIIFWTFVLGLVIGYLIQKSQPIEVVTITKPDTTLINQVKLLEEENEILLDELQFKEGEISYWGRKYDELKNKTND